MVLVIPLLSKNATGADIHNMRGAFLAGLADGMNKALCILQNGEEPIPLDYRDFVNVTYHPNDINEHIAEFAASVAGAFQQESKIDATRQDTFLQALDLGASSAENEMRTLENYYLKTDQFLKALRGEGRGMAGGARLGAGRSHRGHRAGTR